MTDWQPIETAPKDLDILVWDRASDSVQIVKWFNHAVFPGWMIRFSSQEAFDPSHWMPLPEPPK